MPVPLLRTRWMSPGRHETGDRAGRVLPAGDLGQERPAGRDDLHVLGALKHAGDAPGYVIVDGRHLAGPPHHGSDRERAVRLGVQPVGLVPGRVPLKLAALRMPGSGRWRRNTLATRWRPTGYRHHDGRHGGWQR